VRRSVHGCALLRVRAGLSQEALPAGARVGLATLKALERDQRQRQQMHTLVPLAEAVGLAAERAALLELAEERCRPFGVHAQQ
jgi:transcriptional regulator with XRE-family HTH domain